MYNAIIFFFILDDEFGIWNFWKNVLPTLMVIFENGFY